MFVPSAVHAVLLKACILALLSQGLPKASQLLWLTISFLLEVLPTRFFGLFRSKLGWVAGLAASWDLLPTESNSQAALSTHVINAASVKIHLPSGWKLAPFVILLHKRWLDLSARFMPYRVSCFVDLMVPAKLQFPRSSTLVLTLPA